MKYRRLLPLLLASACVAPSEQESTQNVVNARTVISLTFDDTLADQFQVGDLLAARGMRGTFYINAPRLGTSGYMTLAQVKALEQAGHEIGGHTLTHANLPALSDADARTQVCNDRAQLLDLGFRVTSFAYPFGADNSAVQGIVRDCGYNSARDVGGLQSTTYSSCQGCPWTNPVPPANLYMIRTNDSIHVDTPLSVMQQYVIDAENNGGGYVPIVFHHVCNGCNPDSVTVQNLSAFLDWLQTRAPETQVGTVDQEIGGPVRAPVTFPPSTPQTNLAANPSLEVDADGNQVPDCWQRGGYGTNSSTYSLVSDASDGSRAQRIQVTSYTSGGRRLVTAQDSGACAPTATAGHRYTVTAFYKSNVPPRFTAYYRNSSGSWAYFSESPSLPTSTSYRQATYTTPAFPSGATHISIGLTIYAVGTITMDQFSLVDIDATQEPPSDTTDPSATILCNGTACSPDPYTSPVSVSLAGFDFSGIRQIRYTTNGSDPANGTIYSSPFDLGTTTNVRVQVTDNAGNTTSFAKTIRFTATDTTPPALSIACNGAACASTAYGAPVSVSLAATDASGIREIRYTTDGSNPANGTIYTAPFTVSSTTTVRAIATDNANNSATATQTIQVTPADTTPPTLTIACNGTTPCSSTAYAPPVTVTLSSNDAGSGIREVRYTLDGSDPTNGTLYTGSFQLASTTTVRAIAFDNANNSTTLSQTIAVGAPADTTPPTLAIACNGTGCQSTPYSPPVSLSLTATDASGIQSIRYTTDGSDPATSGTIYSGPFSISSTTTVRAIATDNAGNTTTLSQTIAVGAPADTTPPTLTIACNGTTPCSSTPYGPPVRVTLSSNDASGIREVRYTLDGSDPSTGTLYTGSFDLNATATVRAIATDNAGNSTTLSQTIQVAQPDSTPPTLSIACNGGNCTSTFTGPVSITLTASDASGIAEVRYTTNGSDPTAGTLYTGAFTVSSSSTVRATTVDNAGNRTSITQAITISSGPANLLQNASLEVDANGDQIPDCWKRDFYGTNTRTFTLTTDAFDGSRAQRLDITNFSSGGARLASAQDSGACAPAATPGRTYTITAFYKSTAAPRVSVYIRNSSGSWSWFAESSPLPTSTTYRQATYTTPPLPAGTTHISIGVSIFSAGSITTDAYTLTEN